MPPKNSRPVPNTGVGRAPARAKIPTALTHDDRALHSAERYVRQAIFPGIGWAGQARLAQSRALIVGCGALGSTLASNLGRAGVGHLRLVDRDFVEANNLQRQILYAESDVRQRMPKAIAAATRLGQINSSIEVEPHVTDLTADTITPLLDGVDVVLDATDNFAARYLLNDACVKLHVPWIYNGVIAAHGVTMTIIPEETACLRCIFPDRPLPGTTPTCDTAGILNGIVGAVAGIAATEALKLLVGSEQLARGMVWVDLWDNTFERIEVLRAPDCPTCGQGRYEYLDAPLDETGAVLCGRDAVQVRPAGGGTHIELVALAERLAAVGEVATNGYLLRLRVDGYDFSIFPDGRAIIKGTSEPTVARTLYARYVGM